MPPKNIMVYLYSNQSQLILERKVGINKFVQELIKNEGLQQSKDLMSFLTEPDEQFNTQKDKTTYSIEQDPHLNYHLSYTLECDKLNIDKETYISNAATIIVNVAKHPISGL